MRKPNPTYQKWLMLNKTPHLLVRFVPSDFANKPCFQPERLSLKAQGYALGEYRKHPGPVGTAHVDHEPSLQDGSGWIWHPGRSPGLEETAFQAEESGGGVFTEVADG
jgi:hypothetical protein